MTGNCGVITTFSQQWNHSVERQKLKFVIIYHCVVLLEDYGIWFKSFDHVSFSKIERSQGVVLYHQYLPSFSKANSDNDI